MNPDKHLLMGLLALRSDLISERDLISGIEQWIKAKNRPLGQIFIEDTSLTEEQVETLETILGSHAKLGGGGLPNILRSPATSSVVAAIIEKIDDEEVRSSLESLSHSPAGPGQTVELPETIGVSAKLAETKVSSQSKGKRFQIIRSHARGGLGEVFVARDIELNREVAVKEIHAGFTSDEDSRNRFLAEAEITGGLEHPGIVPVYGMGQYKDGRPYYAMRLIKGDSLKEAIDMFHCRGQVNSQKSEPLDSENAMSPTLKASSFASVEFRKLLGRFIVVCQAIGYAHARGVLHRDLKPGNIMLGKYGETMVVDWGLAKVWNQGESDAEFNEKIIRPVFGVGASPTLKGSAVGTPAYMSPEQAAGKLDELGPASDVYSLGATLFHLLTGRTPFVGNDVTAVIEKVKAGMFPAPRSSQPTIPKSLEAICLKAMAIRYADRYSSPQLLAEDIEQFLADESVTAFPEPLVTRIGRWIRKHQTLTVATTAALMVAALGLGVFSTIVRGKNSELNNKNEQLVASNAREQGARALAETNEESARQQSQLALSTLSSVITEVQDGLKNLAGSGKVRQRLLSASLENLEKVATAYVGKAIVDRNTMLSLNELGDVVMQFGADRTEQTTRPNANTLDDDQSGLSLARIFYSRAFEIAQRYADADPEGIQSQRDLFISHSNLGEVQLRFGQLAEALESFQEGLKVAKALTIADPKGAQSKIDLIVAYNRLGIAHRLAGQLTESLSCHQMGLDNSLEMVDIIPSDRDALRGLFHSYDGLGDVNYQLGKTTKSLEFFKKSLEVLQTTSTDPNDTQTQHEVFVIYNKIGDVQIQVSNVTEALNTYKQGLAISQVMVAADQNDKQAKRDQFLSFNRIGDLYLQTGNVDSALDFFNKGLQISKDLAKKNPLDSQAQRDFCIALGDIGDVEFRRGHFNMAIQNYQASLEISRKLTRNDPMDARAKRDMSVMYGFLGDAQFRSGQLAQALNSYQEAMSLRQELLAIDTSNNWAQRDLSISLNKLGDMELSLGNPNQALDFYQEAFDIRKKLLEIDPKDTLALRDMSLSYGNLGDVHLQNGELDLALETYRNGLEISQELANNDPVDAEAQRDLAVSRYQLGEIYQSLEKFELAVDEYEAGAAVLRKMIENGLNVEQSRQDIIGLNKGAKRAKLASKAMGDWDVLVQNPKNELPTLLDVRGTEFVKKSRFVDAAIAAAMICELENADQSQLYNAACVFSLCAASIQPSNAVALAESQVLQRNEWIGCALEALRKSIDAGWNDFVHIQKDSDLAILRELPEFKELLADVDSKVDD